MSLFSPLPCGNRKEFGRNWEQKLESLVPQVVVDSNWEWSSGQVLQILGSSHKCDKGHTCTYACINILDYVKTHCVAVCYTALIWISHIHTCIHAYIRVYLCSHARIIIHMRLHSYILAYRPAYGLAYMHTDTYTEIHTYPYMHTCMHLLNLIGQVNTHMQAHTHVCTFVHTNTQTPHAQYAYTHIRVHRGGYRHTHAHRHTCTYTFTLTFT